MDGVRVQPFAALLTVWSSPHRAPPPRPVPVCVAAAVSPRVHGGVCRVVSCPSHSLGGVSGARSAPTHMPPPSTQHSPVAQMVRRRRLCDGDAGAVPCPPSCTASGIVATHTREENENGAHVGGGRSFFVRCSIHDALSLPPLCCALRVSSRARVRAVMHACPVSAPTPVPLFAVVLRRGAAA